jgi:L-threonylcarbamoyladenylate synthase
MAGVDEAIAAIRAGRLAILPTDTVYGLCASPYRAEPAGRLYRLKGRDDFQPTAIVCSDVEMLFECVPELRGRSGVIARALLPGPYTLVFQNPASRYRWLTGRNSATIGIRVPVLPRAAAQVLEAVGAVAATSANLPGEPAPRRVEEIPAALREGAAAIVDAGELPGVPSTVIDCTGEEPCVTREGAVPAGEALDRLRGALA